MNASWLEVIEPSASEKQVAAWRADSLMLGMCVALEDGLLRRAVFSAGRAARDDLQCGLVGSQNNVARWAKAGARWSASSAVSSTLLNGEPIGIGGGVGRELVDGDEIRGDVVAFRYRHAPADAVLGCAWRAGDLVLFSSPFFVAKPRWYRALALDGRAPRIVTAIVEDSAARDPEARGRVLHGWRNAELVVLDTDVDGPTLRALHERSKQAGGEIDPAFLAAVCAGVKGAVESLDDVVVRFDGAVVSASMTTRIIGDSGVRLRRMLEILGRPVADEPADPRSLAGLVRALFPDEAARHDELVEEVGLLDADGWRARVPQST